MLDLQLEDVEQGVLDAVAQLKCEIKLPASWSDFFDRTACHSVQACERRQSARWDDRRLAGLCYRQTFPALPRAERWYPVYLKNVSRGGAAFLHCEQLFPLERMPLLLAGGVSARLLATNAPIPIEIVWCHWIQSHCYEIGARFLYLGG